MTEVKLLPLFNNIVEDFDKSSYNTDAGKYIENLRKWLLAEHQAQMISDDYGSNRITPVLQFKTDEQAVIFTLRYR
jgi:hypothetical protein